MMWRKFFENIAENRDYVYKYCKNSYRNFDRYCVDWYMYKVVKNNTVTDDDYKMVNNSNNQIIEFYIL